MSDWSRRSDHSWSTGVKSIRTCDDTLSADSLRVHCMSSLSVLLSVNSLFCGGKEREKANGHAVHG